MSKGGTSTQTTSIDPDIKAKYMAQLGQAEKVAAGLPTQQFAGFTPEYQAAEQKAIDLGMRGFKPEDIAQFQNPFESAVVQQSLKDIEEARQMQALQDAQQATAARAFGGSRYGVQSALSNEAALKTAARTAAQLRQAGYGQAAQLAQAARQMDLAGLSNVMNLGLTRQQFAQQQLDALRNLPLQRLGITQSALTAQPANLGQISTTPYYRNVGAGALGGALAGAQLGSIVPGIGTGIGAGIGGLLGLLG